MTETPYSPFDTVFVVGGTHGNERTGVTLVQHWLQNPAEIQRKTFTTELLLGNPAAIQKNIRFIDRDLNRSFLSRYIDGETAETHESTRAREIVATLQSGHTGKRTFAIDLHTTTAHMGITLITNTDPVNLAIAADVQKRLPGARIYCFADSDRINSCLRAAADGGIGVEIGPIPQGVVRHDTLEITAGVVQQILNTIETFNEVGMFSRTDTCRFTFIIGRCFIRKCRRNSTVVYSSSARRARLPAAGTWPADFSGSQRPRRLL